MGMGNTKSKGRFSGNTKFEQTFKKLKTKKMRTSIWANCYWNIFYHNLKFQPVALFITA